MVPGITDTECRVAEFRSRDFHANADRQRNAAQAALTQPEQAGMAAFIHHQFNAFLGRVSRNLHGIHSVETAAAAPALGMGK
jgi:hypothetical protein